MAGDDGLGGGDQHHPEQRLQRCIRSKISDADTACVEERRVRVLQGGGGRASREEGENGGVEGKRKKRRMRERILRG